MEPIPPPPEMQKLPFSLGREIEVSDAAKYAHRTRVEIPGSGDYMLEGFQVAVFGVRPLSSPWTIHVKRVNGQWVAGVDGHSCVFDGVTHNKVQVEGLLTDPADVDDPGWEPPATGFVYLNGVVRDGEVGNITVQISTPAASLDDIKRTTASDGAQTGFAHVIGYLWSEVIGSTTRWYVRQEAFSNLTLMYVVVNGVLCKVPFEM